MTLQEAIEEVKRAREVFELTPFSVLHVNYGECWGQAIATILNAVVKGELK